MSIIREYWAQITAGDAKTVIASCGTGLATIVQGAVAHDNFWQTAGLVVTFLTGVALFLSQAPKMLKGIIGFVLVFVQAVGDFRRLIKTGKWPEKKDYE